jgi:hypothetical protein
VVDDWGFLKEGFKTNQMAPMSPFNSPTLPVFTSIAYDQILENNVQHIRKKFYKFFLISLELSELTGLDVQRGISVPAAFPAW